MDTLPRVLMFVFVITSMLGIGMQTGTADLRLLLASKRLLLRSLLANFAVVPAIGFVMSRTLPLKPEAVCALLLLACTPGGISALQFTGKIKDASLFAGGSAFMLSFFAVFISPALLELLHPARISVVIRYGPVLFFITLFLLLPLALGMLVRSGANRLAERISKPCALISAITFIMVTLLIMGERKGAMNAVGKEGLLCMLTLIGSSMTVGWFMGGPARETRPVLATVTGMRNVALCLFIALETFPGPAVQTPLVAFSALMVPPNMLLTLYIVIRSRRKGRIKV
ncbi:MAG: bile acid:sodium symporter [Syntrophorhabdales bacterium]